MSSVRVIILRIFVLAGILLNPCTLNAQWTLIDSLLEIGAIEIDTSEYMPLFYSGALDYNLMIAASHGYAAEVERLIKMGADVDGRTDSGATPLIFAVTYNRVAAVGALIYFQADLDVVTNRGETPLLISVKNRNFEITEALIRAGADIDFADRHGATPLHYATLYGYLDIVDLLLYYNASIDTKSEEGNTPLLVSVWAGYADVADLLIQNGANMEARDNEGFTPFLMAAFYGDTLLMDLLYKKGVDIYAVNKSNHNALTLSILGNHIEATKLLFRMGNKWSDSNEAISPYSVASKYRRKEVVRILEENNVPGGLKYEIDEVAISLSTRFSFHDLYSGMSFSFKEPFLNAGITLGCDTKLWYSKVLMKNAENLYYQYLDKGSIAYAGLFKDFVLIDSPDRFNCLFSPSLLAGYSFGNKLKGTLISPENKFLFIPAISFKFTRMNFTLNVGAEYLKTGYLQNGPVWLRLGCAYNYFFDDVRTRVKNIKWSK